MVRTFFTSVACMVMLLSGNVDYARAKTARTAEELGRSCAEHTLWGLTAVIKHNSEGMLANQQAVKACVEKAVTLEERNERELFLKSMIERLDSWNISTVITDGFGRSYDLNAYQQGHVALLKFIGIDIFYRALRSLDTLSWGELHPSINAECGSQGQRVLFSEIYLPLERTFNMLHSYTIASIKACHEVGLPCNEVENEVAERIMYYDFGPRIDVVPHAAMLAVELIFGRFGDNVTSFLCGANLFAPLAQYGAFTCNN